MIKTLTHFWQLSRSPFFEQNAGKKAGIKAKKTSKIGIYLPALIFFIQINQQFQQVIGGGGGN